MGSVPLAPGTTEPHQHCPCIEFWRHLLIDPHDPSYSARLWAENTYLLEELTALKAHIRELEQRLPWPATA